MPPVHKVAVVQLYPKPFQVEENYKKAESFIRTAASQGASLAVLPEYHLTSWVPKDPKFVSLCKNWREYLERYRNLARECNICIVPGTIVEYHEEGGADNLYNVAYFINGSGDIIGKYIKKNLWGPERDHLKSSQYDPHIAFDTPIGKVGMLICWDLAFPEAFRELIAQGAQIIIIPTFWMLSDCTPAGLAYNPSAEALFVDSTLTSRAFENTCAVIFANAGGPPGRGYAGLSQVTVPFIGPLSRLGSCAEGMTIVDLDLEILKVAEENYNIRSDIAKDNWHYSYRHTKAKF